MRVRVELDLSEEIIEGIRTYSTSQEDWSIIADMLLVGLEAAVMSLENK